MKFFFLFLISLQIFGQNFSKKPFKVLKERNDQIRFLHSNTLLGYYDNRLKLWDLKGNLIRKINTKQTFLFDIDVSFSNLILSYGSEDKLQIWDDSYDLIKFKKVSNASNFIFLPNKNLLAFSKCKTKINLDCKHSIVYLMDASNLKVITQFKTYKKNIYSINFSSDGKYLVLTADNFSDWNGSGGSSQIQLYSLKSKRMLYSIPSREDEDYRLVQFFPNSKNLAVISSGEKIKIWSLERKKWIFNLKHKDVLSFDISPNQDLIASADRNSFVKIWSLKDFRLKDRFKVGKREIHQISFFPSKKLLVTVEHLGRVSLWRYL